MMEITPVFNEATKSVAIKDFEKQIEECNAWLNSIVNGNFIIQTDADYKKVKEQRAENNNKAKNLATVRKNIVAAYVGQFEDEMTTLEKKLKEREKELKVLIDSYENSKKESKEETKKSATIYSVTCSSLNREDIETLIVYAKKKKITCSKIIEE